MQHKQLEMGMQRRNDDWILQKVRRKNEHVQSERRTQKPIKWERTGKDNGLVVARTCRKTGKSKRRKPADAGKLSAEAPLRCRGARPPKMPIIITSWKKPQKAVYYKSKSSLHRKGTRHKTPVNHNSRPERGTEKVNMSFFPLIESHLVFNYSLLVLECRDGHSKNFLIEDCN
jgi:hypothetical protein